MPLASAQLISAAKLIPVKMMLFKSNARPHEETLAGFVLLPETWRSSVVPYIVYRDGCGKESRQCDGVAYELPSTLTKAAVNVDKHLSKSTGGHY